MYEGMDWAINHHTRNLSCPVRNNGEKIVAFAFYLENDSSWSIRMVLNGSNDASMHKYEYI
jgi:hypothetical protein